METEICSKCGLSKPADQFNPRKGTGHFIVRRQCLACYKMSHAASNRKWIDKRNARLEEHRKFNFTSPVSLDNITFEIDQKVVHNLIKDTHYFVHGFTSIGNVIVLDTDGELFGSFPPEILTIVR